MNCSMLIELIHGLWKVTSSSSSKLTGSIHTKDPKFPSISGPANLLNSEVGWPKESVLRIQTKNLTAKATIQAKGR